MLKVKAVIPGKFNDTTLKEFTDAMERVIDRADKEFAKTYATWKNKPEFEKSIEADNNKVIGSTLTSGEGSRENPYPFVTKGTRVRYAIMTPDFAAKTQPRVIGSGGGRGGLLFVNKNKPMPGIEAREFEEEIEKVIKPVVEKEAQIAMDNIAKKSGYSI
jgi:hypothetical protein